MNKLQPIWIKNQVNQKTKMKLYRALVKSILLYNCSTWGVTQNIEQKLDAFHRRQLRRVLNIKYPTNISNKKLYEKTEEIPISSTMQKSQW